LRVGLLRIYLISIIPIGLLIKKYQKEEPIKLKELYMFRILTGI